VVEIDYRYLAIAFASLSDYMRRLKEASADYADFTD